MDKISGFKNIVDRIAELDEQIKKLTSEINDEKESLREIASSYSKDNSSVIFSGTKCNASICFSNKKQIKFKKDFEPEKLPEDIRKEFFVEQTKYIPIDAELFQISLEKHKEFSDRFIIELPTPAVKIIKL